MWRIVDSGKKDSLQRAFSDRIQLKLDMEERLFFKDEEQRRRQLQKRAGALLVMSVGLLLLFVFSLFFVTNFRYGTSFTLASYLGGVRNSMNGFYNFIIGHTDTAGTQFIFFRALIAILVGASLSCCGTVYQGAFRNALASPLTLGVQAGGILMGVLSIVLFSDQGSVGAISFQDLQTQYQGMSIFQKSMQSTFILIGGLLSVFLVVGIATIAGRGKVTSLTLILCGFVFSSLISSISALIEYYMLLYYSANEQINAIRTMVMGTFNNVFTFRHLLLVGIPILICLMAILLLRNQFNLLVFGEDDAKAMGMRVGLFRGLMIGICSVIVGVTLSYCGQMGFIGLVVPHIARLAVGPDFRWLIPASMLMGGIVMLLSYNVAVAVGYAENLNVVTSVVCGLTFLFFLIIYRRKRNADWA